MTDDTGQQVVSALKALRPLVALLPPTAAVPVGLAIAALDLLLAEPEPVDAQDVVTPRNRLDECDLAGLAAHDR